MIHMHPTERMWLRFGFAILAIFIGIITFSAVVEGLVPPSHVQRIDPAKISTTPPFSHPGLHQVGDHVYEAYYVARIFSFTPTDLTIPVGSRVTFYVTSPDVVHGFSIPQTGVNVMVTPGWVSTVSYTFKKAGSYLLLCNEYCGALHHMMSGKIIVQ
jgi:cytochrome c oxidase subunit 2